ncbi:MAG: signal peptidase II [Candidatus Marinimicrobia bacterium]|nr:signal peptidase II [Candidatus Neomarinimicrobiota bacterium]
MRKRKKYLIIAIIAGLILLYIDLQLKSIVNNSLVRHKPINTFIPVLDLYLTHNTGYHYIFGEIDNHKLWSLFGLVMGLILISSFSYSILKEDIEKFYLRIYAIVLALTIGAMGNVLEIIFTGKATDYFIFHPFPWPSNLCDQYINAIIYIVIPIILIRYIFKKIQDKQKLKKG